MEAYAGQTKKCRLFQVNVFRKLDDQVGFLGEVILDMARKRSHVDDITHGKSSDLLSGLNYLRHQLVCEAIGPRSRVVVAPHELVTLRSIGEPRIERSQEHCIFFTDRHLLLGECCFSLLDEC